MKKSHKIMYWIATVWLALGMVSTAIVQLLHLPEEVDNFTHLGYPLYLLNILGIWKLLGAMAVLAPGFARIKEWAYAGFFFAMSGAILSHMAVGNSVEKIFPSLLLLVLTIISWQFRPSDRKIA